MTSATWYVIVAAVLTGLGLVRMLTAAENLTRLIAVNVTGAGTLLALVGLAARAEIPDPVPHALALTGIVITVAFTAVGLLLSRRLEQHADTANLTADLAANLAAEDPTPSADPERVGPEPAGTPPAGTAPAGPAPAGPEPAGPDRDGAESDAG